MSSDIYAAAKYKQDVKKLTEKRDLSKKSTKKYEKLQRFYIKS